MSAILYPVFVMVVLTLYVAISLAYRRVNHLRKNRIHPQTAPTRVESSQVYSSSQALSDNLQNLFEFPVLFYFLVTLLLITHAVDPVFIGLAWAYVVLRVLHTFIHTRHNKVVHRFYMFIASTLVLTIMWAKFAWFYF